ncbi:TrbG/VirB9 family P-type conjugative transfer protein [Chelatococcus asaccharovorans]|uniref:TrbG/VirB9 family P-type conjugative transfer protein n=1 Tax=Chelatococcus asaccharovorans TaxID=28210 RepID=UPI0039756F33
MSANEAKGTGISGQWRGSRGLVTKGPDGKVIFLFGEVQPSVVCSPLQVCDIELQPGEVVRDVLIGDTVRWKVEPATSGAVGGQAIHLIVKPSEPGLVTSIVVTTSRRTYHIQLKSHQTQYMARVGFEYPEDVSAKFADVPPVDRYMRAYVDRLPLRRHYRFYERTEPARTKPSADVAALERHRESRRERRADEDEIADHCGMAERLDAPQTKRIAWRRVDAVAAQPAHRRDGEDA